eukprot:2118603-Alexandrium_andersonii.AAC.1
MDNCWPMELSRFFSCLASRLSTAEVTWAWELLELWNSSEQEANKASMAARVSPTELPWA